MGLFGARKENEYLRRENQRLRNACAEKDALCMEKDAYFMELMADALRHGSSLAGKHMADRKKYKNDNY